MHVNVKVFDTWKISREMEIPQPATQGYTGSPDFAFFLETVLHSDR